MVGNLLIVNVIGFEGGLIKGFFFRYIIIWYWVLGIRFLIIDLFEFIFKLNI